MRRVIALVTALLLLPQVAMAADLDRLLEDSREASYSAEQLISCDTPDGARDAVIELQQRGGEVRYGGKSGSGPEVWSGYGNWVVEAEGSVVEGAVVSGANTEQEEAGVYIVTDGESTSYLGRDSTRYSLLDGDLSRAELVVDNETGVLMSITTFDAEGRPYCERRFISYDPTEPEWPAPEGGATEELTAVTDSSLPETLGDFERLDVYVDAAGLNFGYYSDGFFSFAVFESAIEIVLEGGSPHRIGKSEYQREFTPGQVTYTWPVDHGGMALIGDLPPDMHEAVLAGLPAPYDAGFFKRLWRSLFG